MSRLKAWPTWRKWTAGAIVVLLVIGAASGGSDNKASLDRPATVGSPAPTPPTAAADILAPDATTLYDSLALVFIRRYRRVFGSTYQLSPDSSTHCDDAKGGDYSCEMRIDIPIVADESWVYTLSPAGAAGCWVAQLTPRYGPDQDQIDSYRNRDTFAPTAADVRRYLRQTRRLRSLAGCASNVPQPHQDDSPTRFIAALAAQNVQRERPGRQHATTCRYLGKQVISLAPDSYDFACRTSMASGAAFADKISCFDAPPYSNFDSCSEESGYPKRPPRQLPT